MSTEPALPGIERGQPKFREGERVRVVERDVTAKDRKANAYYSHMAGLTGVVTSYFSDDEIAIQVDLESLGDVPKDVHAKATQRMREKFLDSVGDEQRKLLTPEELQFTAHYVILCRASDLEKV